MYDNYRQKRLLVINPAQSKSTLVCRAVCTDHSLYVDDGIVNGKRILPDGLDPIFHDTPLDTTCGAGWRTNRRGVNLGHTARSTPRHITHVSGIPPASCPIFPYVRPTMRIATRPSCVRDRLIKSPMRGFPCGSSARACRHQGLTVPR